MAYLQWKLIENSCASFTEAVWGRRTTLLRNSAARQTGTVPRKRGARNPARFTDVPPQALCSCIGATTMAVRLLIVEDQPVVRSGLETLLKDAEIVALDTAATAADAIQKAATSQADLVLMDVRLADGDGLAALARIKAEHPGLPVLVYTAYDNPAYAARAIALGAA